MRTAVVIPTFNRRETLRSCLENLFDLMPGEHQVIVVDSGSSDGTSEMVRGKFPQVVLISGDSSMWWAAATNLGIRKAQELGCGHVLTYNDDNIATRGLFEALNNAAHTYPGSIISAICCYLDRPETIFFAGRMRAERTDRFYYLDHNVPLSAVLNTGAREVDLLHGMCTLFPMNVFETVGLFDESAFPSLFADDDLALRAVKAGYRLRVALDAVVLNDRTKTGLNPYDKRLGPIGVWRLLTSRKSTFQLTARTRFLWRHRRSPWYFCKTWSFDYARMISLIAAKWVLPRGTFQRAGRKWIERLHRT